ncbi:hypothetical protein BCR44DRAFT_43637 [Catenaria anguillulae PL171]|uniref:Uncharacterized protein n=1 Tax=Catenaria anguillulae PL171 TaxID=765915 RepID=A0A1Y2HXT3_9FUNG|nr:hypothetical protein BCR44DRAFT_43637 [Catenaria anguillulae PL171]
MPFTTDPTYGGSAARCADKPATVALAPTASAAGTHSDDPAVISALQDLLSIATNAGPSSEILTDHSLWSALEDDVPSVGDQTNLFPPPPDVAPGHQQAPPQQPSQLPVHPTSSFSHPLLTPSGPAFLASAANTVPPSVAPADLAASVHHACGYGPVQPPDDEPEPIVTAVRVISDRIAAANPEVMRHKFETGVWTLTYFTVKGDDDIELGAKVAVGTDLDAVDVDEESDQGEYEATVTVPVKVTTTTAGLVDLKWEASLIPIKQLKKVVDLDQLIAGSNWSALRATGSMDAGELTQIGARTLPLTLTFNVTPRRKYLLVVVVNGIVVNGLPKKVIVRCDRQARRDINLKRKAEGVPGDEEDDKSDLPESSPAPVAKRAKMAAVDEEIAELLAPLVSAQSERAPVTPPPSPQFGPHFCPEVALLGMMDTTSMFNHLIHNLLRVVKFSAEVIHKATLPLIKKHIRGGANLLWSTAQIVETFALLGNHADVIRQHFWTSTVAYPDPLHALAHCTRPDLVAAMFEYLHPRQLPAPVLAPCPQSSHLSHKPMGCDSCRAFATNVALSRANESGFLPIHVAAWKKNSIFVEHHLRIMGAKSTFAAANQRDGDGGNFFHATCGSKSAVEWLEKLWGDVILEVADRQVVAHALQMEDDRGRTPLDMAKFQVEVRKETANGTKQRTLQWVKEKIAMFA